MLKALETNIEEDLFFLRDYLFSRNIDHRISESGGRQTLWVFRLEHVGAAIDAYEKFKTFPAKKPQVSTSATLIAASLMGLLRFFSASPATSSLVLLSVLVFICAQGDGVPPTSSVLMSKLFFSPVTSAGDQFYFLSLEQVILSGEWWRLVTPMFIHFSWIHIIFNLLWCVELGKKIEKRIGYLFLSLLVIFSSLSSNLIQYFIYGPSFFGGLSGVVYGLLGYCFAWGKMVPRKKFDVSKGIYSFMFIFLMLGFSGLIDLLGIGKIANGAHLGGLTFGLLLGFLSGAVSRVRKVSRGPK